ncbi:MAG TPA: ABC transporter permease subunit, partial [Bauldia sp.]|nr:ABC transporter permease subunit [Bauldia sp.]
MIALRALFVAVGLVAIWQAVVLVFAPPAFMLPAPVDVFEALRDRPNLWRVDAVTTLTESLIGLVAGTLLGIGLALLMSLLPVSRRLLLPVMVVSQALPVFAIAPILALWFGFGLASKVVMATIAIFFPVASAFHDGLSRTDPG